MVLGAWARIPGTSVPDVAPRLRLYKRVSEAKSAEDLRELQVEFIDRFGLLPEPAKRLFEQAELRLACAALGVVKLRAQPAVGFAARFPVVGEVDDVKRGAADVEQRGAGLD